MFFSFSVSVFRCVCVFIRSLRVCVCFKVLVFVCQRVCVFVCVLVSVLALFNSIYSVFTVFL